MEIIKENTVAFTGNRNLTTLDGHLDRNLENVIRTELYYLIESYYKQGKDTYLNGGAVGFDMMAAEVVLELKKRYPSIRLITVIPFMGQELRYSPSDKERYKHIFEASDSYVLIWEGGYSTAAYHKRNDYLIANSSTIIAYSNGIGKGTKSTVEKAQKRGMPVVNLFYELQGYFTIKNSAKTYLQRFTDMPSIRYFRDGVIFNSDNDPLRVNFAQIENVELVIDVLRFTLKNGTKIYASSLIDHAEIELPTSNK